MTANLQHKKKGSSVHKQFSHLQPELNLSISEHFIISFHNLCILQTVQADSGPALWQGFNRAEPHRKPHEPPETIRALPPFELKEESGLIFYLGFHVTAWNGANAGVGGSGEHRKGLGT